MELNTIKDRLIFLRGELKLNGRQFAKSIGVDPSQYSKIESGKLNIDNYVRAISELYNVNANWLLFGQGNVFTENQIQNTLLTSEPNEDYLTENNDLDTLIANDPILKRRADELKKEFHAKVLLEQRLIQLEKRLSELEEKVKGMEG